MSCEAVGTPGKQQADSRSLRPNFRIQVYGSNGRGNPVNVDGGESNAAGGGVSREAVQEFQVDRSNYSSEHSASRGGVVNIITKSGSNATHGSAFGFFRNQGLNAANPFVIALDGNQVKRVKPAANRQQFGATIGGTIRPDKTFYFIGYEQLRRRESSPVPVLTEFSIFQPTAAQEAVRKPLLLLRAEALRISSSTA